MGIRLGNPTFFSILLAYSGVEILWFVFQQPVLDSCKGESSYVDINLRLALSIESMFGVSSVCYFQSITHARCFIRASHRFWLARSYDSLRWNIPF